MADERSDQKRSSQATVFGASDQSEMISRLDAVEDDDLDSGFFEASVQDAADAAVRMFDVGIRAMAEEPDGTGASPFTSASTGASAPQPGRDSRIRQFEQHSSSAVLTLFESSPLRTGRVKRRPRGVGDVSDVQGPLEGRGSP